MYEVDLDENFKLGFLRERVIGVIDFVWVLAERIVKQEHLEKEIVEVGQLRHQWFESLSKVDDLVSLLAIDSSKCSYR
jgi:flagellar biosynthesis chaperone FliJ